MVRNGNSVRVFESQNGIRKTDAVLAEILLCLFRILDYRHVESVHLYVRRVKQLDTSSLHAVGKSVRRGVFTLEKASRSNWQAGGASTRCLY
jgi:hypothetical protein